MAEMLVELKAFESVVERVEWTAGQMDKIQAAKLAYNSVVERVARLVGPMAEGKVA